MIKIDREVLYEKYMDLVNRISDDIPEKDTFNVWEIVNYISNILENEPKCLIPEQDKIVSNVIKKYRDRSIRGIAKYKTTLQQNNYDDFLKHLQEELLDASLYVEKLMSQQNKSDEQI